MVRPQPQKQSLAVLHGAGGHWLREARRIVHEQGATALRDNIAWLTSCRKRPNVRDLWPE